MVILYMFAYLSLAYAGRAKKTGIFILGTLKIMNVDLSRFCKSVLLLNLTRFEKFLKLSSRRKRIWCMWLWNTV